MQKKLHYKGIWFLPNSETQLSGTLEFSPREGIELHLLGILGNRNNRDAQLKIILGVTSDGRRITLYKCTSYQSSFHSNGIETSSYGAIYMFEGKHFSSVKELQFTGISCRFKNFDYWLGIYGFRRIDYVETTKQTFIEYQRPADLRFTISDDKICEFQFGTYAPTSKRTAKATIKQVCEVSLLPSEGVTHFDSIFSWYQIFYGFLLLAYFGNPVIKRMFVSVKQLSKDNEEYDKDIEVYFKTPSLKGVSHKRNHRNYYLFTYDIIKDNFESVLSKWFAAEEKLQPTINGLVEAFSVREQVTEFKFLNLAHALETYHQRKELETVGKKTKRTYLHTRLKELAALIPEEIKRALFKPDVATFISDIKESRNYYTHYSEEKKDRALQETDLFFLSERMKIFLICLVLQEIGFTNEEVTKTILRKGVWLFNHIIKPEEVQQYFSDWG